MKNILTISQKEMSTYLTSPMAYVVTAVFLALTGSFFGVYLAETGYTDTSIRGFLEAAKFLILLFAAVLTMRLIAEERKLGTWELLMTAPVRDSEIVLGKFFGCLAVLAGMLGLTLYYPLLLIVLGDPDLGPMLTSYIGLLLLGSTAVAVGLFASSVTSNQIVAAVVGGGILFALWFLRVPAELIPGGGGEFIAFFSLSSHFPGFVRGIIDTRAIVYYVSVTAVFLYMTIRSIEADRWR